MTSSPVVAVYRELIVTAAARHKLPAIYVTRYMVAGGELISYGLDFVDQYRRAAGYVDRIRPGWKAGRAAGAGANQVRPDIQSEAAKALGLDVPPTLLAHADEVIE